MVKTKIRAFTVLYSKRKSFRSRQEEAELLKKFNVLQRKPDCNFDSHTNKEVNCIKQKLERISERKTQGCILRIKCRWYELGERNNKYFLNLQTRNYKKKHITLLKDNEHNSITNPNEILKQEKCYYEMLYSTTRPNPAGPNFAIFFYENIPTLTQTEREHCEGIFSNRECLNALKKVGNLVGDIVVDSFNHVLQRANSQYHKDKE